MTEAEWLTTERAQKMIDRFRIDISERKMTLIACSFCRLTLNIIGDERSRRAVIAAEEAVDSPTPDEILRPVQAGAGEAFDEATRNISHAAFIPGMAAFILAHGGGYDALGHVPHSARPPHRADIVRCVVGNPFHPITFLPEWRTTTVIALAEAMYESRDFSAMPILADALGDAGCEEESILNHCRGPGPHARGCHVIDALTGRS